MGQTYNVRRKGKLEKKTVLICINTVVLSVAGLQCFDTTEHSTVSTEHPIKQASLIYYKGIRRKNHHNRWPFATLL